MDGPGTHQRQESVREAVRHHGHALDSDSPGFKFQLQHVLLVWPWTSGIFFLSLPFPICTQGRCPSDEMHQVGNALAQCLADHKCSQRVNMNGVF